MQLEGSLGRLEEQLRGTPTRSLVIAVLMVAIVLGGLGLVALSLTEALVSSLEDAAEWMEDNLPWSVPVYFFLFFAAMCCMLPASPFAVGLGFTYGVPLGLFIHLMACCFAANLIFFLSGYMFREGVEARIRKFPKFSALRHMVKEPSSAFKLVFLSCQTPVPFGLHVGFFSVSGVAAVTFFQAFLLGLVPLSLLSLYIGDAAAMADQGLQGNTSGLEAASFWIGLLASIGFVAYIVWHGRSVLESIETSDGGEGQLLVDKPEEQAALAP